MSRVAIIGSCITRDIWRECDLALDNVLYISRSSLPSLTSGPLAVLPDLPADPPPIDGIGRHSIRMVEADLRKSALASLVEHRPTHIIFDFIDERFDLLEQDGAIVTRSWELDCLELIGGPGLPSPRVIPRLSDEVDALWQAAAEAMGRLLNGPALAEAKVIIHHTQWARTYRQKTGETGVFDLGPVDWEGHNALLRRYRDLLLSAVPRAKVVEAPSSAQTGDEGHIWGLSPFHYAPDYYADVWRQLQALGVSAPAASAPAPGTPPGRRLRTAGLPRRLLSRLRHRLAGRRP